MSLRRLRTEEMVAVTSTWVDREHADHQALAAVTALAGLLPEIEAAHHGLHVTYRAARRAARLEQIQAQQKELDLEHDDVVRAIWFALQAHVCLTREPAEREKLAWLRDRLLPAGLQAVNRSYREEAGQAELASSRLTDRDRELLQSIVMRDGRTLLDLVRRWRELAAQIGTLDRERAGDVADGAPTRAEALAARNRWIRAIQTMRNVAALVSGQDPAVSELLAHVAQAERTAERRAVARSNS